ncbi:serine/threonine-protein kinase [Actinoplanes subglobosus]|uniref:non-specific serine/threonine protein kinase n=1 Tax=Actinoplanes subglobosus TaxID=1547892 RepID=A0ABV8IRA0_9ACTN
MPHTGELLGGRYRLDDRIAAGGMGEVWQATDTVLGRAVAVKTLLADRATDPGFQRRFRHEAQALAALRHPGVVAVYDFGNTAVEDAYLVMARVEGQPLNRMLADRGRLSPAETMSVVAQAAQALEAAHEAGIVHRDVKPGNLLIEPDGTVVLVDFGVARSAHSGTVTGAGEVVGTALYIAPEQVAQHQAGPPADVYALGALAYHCLAGHPPFEGRNPIAIALQHLEDEPPELPGDVPPEVREIVRIALSKKPEDRFSSAGVMAEAARVAAAGLEAGSPAAEVAGSPTAGIAGSPTAGVPAPATGSDEGLTATRAGSPWIGALGMQPLDDTSIGAVLDDTAPGVVPAVVPPRRPATQDRTGLAAPAVVPPQRPAAPPGTGPETLPPTGRRRLLPLFVLAAVVLLGGIGVLFAADPLGWFADAPKPTTNAPAAPVSSAPRSAEAPAGGGDGGRETTRPERTGQTENDERPTTTATTTRPAEPTTTTAPTATETTGETATPTATATTPAETGEPGDDETDPGDTTEN